MKFILQVLMLCCNMTICYAGFKFGDQASRVKIANGAQVVLRAGLNITEGTLEFITPSLSSLQSLSSGVNVSNGFIKSDNNLCAFSGTLTTTSAQVLTIDNGQTATFTTPNILSQKVAIAAGATASITGNPIFGAPLFLGDAASILQLNISSILSQAITGNGWLRLLNDLTVAKNVSLPGKIDLNGFRLNITSGIYGVTTTVGGFGIGGALAFLGYSKFTNPWTIGSVGESYTLFGYGNTLEFSNTGGIIFNGNDLTISNIILKGVSDANPLKGSGVIKLSNTVIELGGNFTRNDGQFIVIGSNCKLITNGYSFTMSGIGNDLTVDGVLFFFEQLNSGVALPPLYAINGAYINLLNGGDLAKDFALPQAGIGGVSNIFTSASNTLAQSYFVTSSGVFQINNATPATPFAVSIDGAGNFLDFSYATLNDFVLQNNVQLSLTNVVLKSFDHKSISYGTSSTITFGDGVRIVLGPDLTIDSGDKAWTFVGNSEIDGNGATLTINKSQGITITNAKTLTLKDLRLVIASVDALKALSSTATIKLQGVDLVIQNQGFTFSQGSLIFSDRVRVKADSGSTILPVNFEFSSSGTMTVAASSELEIFEGINLKYNANPSVDTTLYASKRHFVFEKIGSKMTLHGCSLESTNTGLALDQGIIKIYDKVSIVSTTATGADFEIGMALQLNIAADANLCFKGPVSYSEGSIYATKLNTLSSQGVIISNLFTGYDSLSTSEKALRIQAAKNTITNRRSKYLIIIPYNINQSYYPNITFPQLNNLGNNILYGNPWSYGQGLYFTYINLWNDFASGFNNCRMIQDVWYQSSYSGGNVAYDGNGNYIGSAYTSGRPVASGDNYYTTNNAWIVMNTIYQSNPSEAALTSAWNLLVSLDSICLNRLLFIQDRLRSAFATFSYLVNQSILSSNNNIPEAINWRDFDQYVPVATQSL